MTQRVNECLYLGSLGLVLKYQSRTSELCTQVAPEHILGVTRDQIKLENPYKSFVSICIFLLLISLMIICFLATPP